MIDPRIAVDHTGAAIEGSVPDAPDTLLSIDEVAPFGPRVLASAIVMVGFPGALIALYATLLGWPWWRIALGAPTSFGVAAWAILLIDTLFAALAGVLGVTVVISLLVLRARPRIRSVLLSRAHAVGRVASSWVVAAACLVGLAYALLFAGASSALTVNLIFVGGVLAIAAVVVGALALRLEVATYRVDSELTDVVIGPAP